MTASMNADVKSIPIRCLIEIKSEPGTSCNTSGNGLAETESFAIVPSNSLFRNVVKTALSKLGYSSQDIASAKGAVQIKNWRPLDLEQVTDNAFVSVEDMLGDLTTVATLRIRILSKRKSEDVKDKLLLMLIGQSFDVLIRQGCPIAKDDLEKVVAGHDEFSAATQTEFYAWYNKYSAGSVAEEVTKPTAKEETTQIVNKAQQPSAVPAKATRLRISFDSEEVARLQQWFDLDQHPSRHLMTKYLAELNDLPARGAALKPLDLTNIMYWFKNARAAARRNGKSITSEDLSDDEGQIERETSMSAPPLPNSNAVYVIKDPLVAANKQTKQDEVIAEDDDSEMEEELSVTDDESETNGGDAESYYSSKPMSDVAIKDEMDVSKPDATTGVTSTSSSPKVPTSFMNGMAPRIPGYPFPYGALPMAYLQSQINPFYKDWSEKVQSAVAQAQANTAQQNLALLKNKSECELSKAERQKRHRAFIDPVSEIPKLEQWFTKDTHPSHYVIEQICDDLNRGEFRSRYPKLSPKNIQLWFKNHRAKVKRMRVGGGSLSFSGMGSPQMSPPSGLALSMME